MTSLRPTVTRVPDYLIGSHTIMFDIMFNGDKLGYVSKVKGRGARWMANTRYENLGLFDSKPDAVAAVFNKAFYM